MPRYKVDFNNGLSIIFEKKEDKLGQYYVPSQIRYNDKDINGFKQDDEGRVKFNLESDDAKKIFDILHPFQAIRYLIGLHGEFGECPMISYLECADSVLKIGIIASINAFDYSEVSESCPVNLLGKHFDEGYDSSAAIETSP